MKTTLDLPDELIREAKLRAAMQGRTLRDLVADFLRQGLGMVPPAAFALPYTVRRGGQRRASSASSVSRGDRSGSLGTSQLRCPAVCILTFKSTEKIKNTPILIASY